MVRKTAGEKKKDLIINTCKKLFYQKGYSDTTFEDISREADIFPGAITYHFNNKINIAGIIRAEFEYQLDYLIKTSSKGICDLRVQNALDIINYFKLFYTNLNLRRFIFETYQEGISSAFVFEPIRSFFLSHIRDYALDINDRELDLITACYIGFERELLNMAYKDMEKYTSEDMSNFIIKTMYKLLGYDYASINSIISEANKISLQLNINFEYFKYFKYDESLISTAKLPNSSRIT